MDNRIIRVGVVGAGFIANSSHLPVLTHLPDNELVAICDTSATKAQKTAERFRIPKVYSDFAEMLATEAIDVIDILTPPETHAALAIQAMGMGRHCLIEKPMSVSTTEADRMIEVAQTKNLALHVTHTYSFTPCIRKARSIVASGAVGELVGIDIKFLTSLAVERYREPEHWVHRLHGGVFTDITPHLVMLLLDFLGKINSVKVMSKKLSSYPHIPADELMVMVEAENGLGTLALSFNSAFRGLVVDIFGTKANLHVDGNSQTVVIHKSIKSPGSMIEKGARGLSEIFQQVYGLASITAGTCLGKYAGFKESHRYLIQKSLESIRGNGEYPVELWKCREVIRLLETIYGEIQ